MGFIDARIVYDTDGKKITDKIGNLVQKGDIVFNVKDYGAVGDGVTDDTTAFNNAITAIKTVGGGRLFIPKTNSFYLLKDGVTLCDNLYIFSNGATLKKNGTSINYYVFQSLSGINIGYGSGANNVIIEGLNINGSFADVRGASITLHHADNVTIRNCIFSECVVSGHPIDICGCSNIIVDNCYFYGFLPQSGREYVEAIEIDYSTASGCGLTGETFDGLPSKNVTVQNCKFLPLTLNGTTYEAPNPFGSHMRVDGMVFTNIKFLNNYVENAHSIGVSDSTYAVGWLHFYHVDGLEIIGNQFINTKGNPARVLGLYTIDTAVLSSGYNDPNAPNQAYTSIACKNVKFKRNKVKGFSDQNNYYLIYLQGRLYNSTAYYIENMQIAENEFLDCFNLGGSATYNICSDVINGDYVKGLKVLSNVGSNIKRLLYLTNSKKVEFNDNNLINAYWNPFNLGTTDIITVLNNTLDGCGAGFYFATCNKITVKHNSVINDNSSALSSYGDIIALKTCTRFTVKDNDLDGVTSSPYTSIHCYTTCNNGKLKDNFISGFVAQSISADSTNIVTA